MSRSEKHSARLKQTAPKDGVISDLRNYLSGQTFNPKNICARIGEPGKLGAGGPAFDGRGGTLPSAL